MIEVELEADEGCVLRLVGTHLGGRERTIARKRQRIAGSDPVGRQGPSHSRLPRRTRGRGDAWRATSAGYVGSSDGWQDFAHNGALTWKFDAAARQRRLVGELPSRATLALAFGTSRESPRPWRSRR